MRLDLSWKRMLSMPKSLLTFCLGDIHSEPTFYLCSKTVCTTAHILGTCKVDLQEGRFIYCHYSVLQAFLTALETFLSSYLVGESLQQYINFVRLGKKIKKSMKKTSHWPSALSSWLESYIWFQWKVSYSIWDSNIPTKTRHIYFFKRRRRPA